MKSISQFEISQKEAWYWWRTSVGVGAILYRLMLLFIIVPVWLVAKDYLLLSFVVFAGMIPYGFFLRRLAERSVSNFIRKHPEAIVQFEETGVITR